MRHAPTIVSALLSAPWLLGCASDADHAARQPAPNAAVAPELEPAPEPMPEPQVASRPISLMMDYTTPEGLRIQDLQPGVGPPVTAGATVEIDFVAALARADGSAGEVFDSSERRKRPLTFSLANNSLIRGLREGIPGMTTGSSRRLSIPWRLAYGEAGRDPVPPKTDLIFEITLLRWDAPTGSASPAAPR